jgi:hypothetical protein
MSLTMRLTTLTILGAAALTLASCKSDDSFLTENPKNIIVADNLYTNLAGFEAGLNALYANVRRERYGTDNTTNDLVQTLMTSGTDNVYGNYLSLLERIFNEWGVRNTPTDAFMRSFWNLMYQTINASNTIINRAENPAIQWSPDDRDRVIAEARLIRAWSYRHLTYLFGDVPVTLTESTGENIKTDWDRVPRDSVRRIIVADLQFAEAHLPATSSNPGKLVKAVAQHYLAEMYLALGDPAKAETEAAAVINSGLYSLVTARYGVQASQPGVAFMDQFKDGNVNRSQGNTEVLWALEYAINTPGGGASIMRRTWVTRYESNRGMQISADDGGRGIGRLAITRWALNLYEPNDVRGGPFAIRRFYLYNNPANLPAGKKLGDTLFTVVPSPIEKNSDPLVPSTRKWDYANPIDITGAEQYNDQPYIRLAETYLLLAEAQLKQGKTAEAAASINKVRARAGASLITPAQVTLDFILDERSRELVTEEERRYTLLRTGTWLDRTKKDNPFIAAAIQPRDTLLPIPQDVIDANTGKPMKQNPGF